MPSGMDERNIAERKLSNHPFAEAEETRTSFRERVGHPLFGEGQENLAVGHPPSRTTKGPRGRAYIYSRGLHHQINGFCEVVF